MPNLQSVFVLSSAREPLMPTHPARARELLKGGRAAVFRRYPFTIILKERQGGVKQPLTLKIDPGSKITGMALVTSSNRVVFAAELEHRGKSIKANLDSRRSLRRSRRSRKTRYRAARFNNRTRPEGWLPPSLQHRVDTTMTWIARFRRFCGLSALSVERVKFDMQLIRNPEISGVEYQQGTLTGYTVREYLLEKWGRKCAYCQAENVPLQVEHIRARANGGTNAVSNLALACEPCNAKKGTMPVEAFLKNKPDALQRILAQAKRPLSDAAAVNATRNALFFTMRGLGLPLECGTGAQTKFNRINLNYPKAHWIDAACIGTSGSTIALNADMAPLRIKAMGHGSRQMCQTDKYGFPINHRSGRKVFFGFQTGDIAKANIPSGKYTGIRSGRVVVRSRPSFAINRVNIHPKYLTKLQKADGYNYV